MRKRKGKMYIGDISTFVFTLFVIISIITLVVCQMTQPKVVEVMAWDTHIVSQGDTLWSISKDISQNNKDTRDIVSLIRERNNISPTLQVGQEIIVPNLNIITKKGIMVDGYEGCTTVEIHTQDGNSWYWILEYGQEWQESRDCVLTFDTLGNDNVEDDIILDCKII